MVSFGYRRSDLVLDFDRLVLGLHAVHTILVELGRVGLLDDHAFFTTFRGTQRCLFIANRGQLGCPGWRRVPFVQARPALWKLGQAVLVRGDVSAAVKRARSGTLRRTHVNENLRMNMSCGHAHTPLIKPDRDRSTNRCVSDHTRTTEHMHHE